MKIQVKKIAKLTGHNASIYALTQGREKHLLLSGSGDGWVVEWNLNDPELGKLVAKAESNIFSLCQKNELIIAGNMNGGVHWIYPDVVALNKNISHHKKGMYDAQIIENELITSGGKGVLTKWSIEERRALLSIQLSGESLRRMSFRAIRQTGFKTKKEIAIGASDGNIYFLDAEHFEIKKIINAAHENSVFTVRYSLDGKYLISGGRDAMMKVWDLENNYKMISSQPAHWFTINDIAFHPNGKLLATASRDKTVKIWDAENFKLLKVLDATRGGHVNSVNTLLWSEHNNWLVSGSDDRSLIIWEID